MLASADESYTLVLNENKNVLTDGSGSGTFVTEKGTALSVDYQLYMSSSGSWGRIGPGGYIQNAHGEGGRIGGLVSISYEITRALTIEYGFDAYPGKEFCRSATLSRSESTFSFGDEKPDRFRISASGDWSSIISMTFTYSCSPTDSHTHEFTTDKLGRVGSTGSYQYKHICDICGEPLGAVEDLSGYKVTLDGNVYDPYNFDTYSGIGSLDFDYNGVIESGNRRFVLTINGDHSSSNLTIDANHTIASQIYIKSENNAKVHDIYFNGGYGILLFIGDKLTFANGNLITEAMVTSVKGPLSFEDTRKSKDAITVSNGAIYLENNVDITGYNVGVRMSRNVTGENFYQTGGTFTIKNTNRGLVSKTGYKPEHEYDAVFSLRSTCLFEDCEYAASYGVTLEIRGSTTIKNCDYGVGDSTVNVNNYLNIDSCYHGLHHSNIQVGDSGHTGLLHIYVDDNDAKSDSDRACGIYTHNSNTINFYKGKAAIFSGSQNTRTSAIKVGNNEGWNNDMFSVSSSDFVYGFGNIKYGFDCESNASQAGQETFSNSSADTFKYYGVGDRAWYCGNKPTGQLLDSINTFKQIFEIQ